MNKNDNVETLAYTKKKMAEEIRDLKARIVALEKENTLLSLYGRG